MQNFIGRKEIKINKTYHLKTNKTCISETRYRTNPRSKKQREHVFNVLRIFRLFVFEEITPQHPPTKKVKFFISLQNFSSFQKGKVDKLCSAGVKKSTTHLPLLEALPGGLHVP